MTWAPNATVAAVIYRPHPAGAAGHYLMVHEETSDGMRYNQPAGHLEQGESLEQAMLRETFEETGWRVRPSGLLNITLFTSPHNQVTYHRTTFLAEAIEAVPEAILDDGIHEAVWLTYEEILARRDSLRSQVVLEVIEDHRQGICYPLEMIRTRGGPSTGADSLAQVE